MNVMTKQFISVASIQRIYQHLCFCAFQKKRQMQLRQFNIKCISNAEGLRRDMLSGPCPIAPHDKLCYVNLCHRWIVQTFENEQCIFSMVFLRSVIILLICIGKYAKNTVETTYVHQKYIGCF